MDGDGEECGRSRADWRRSQGAWSSISLTQPLQDPAPSLKLHPSTDGVLPRVGRPRAPGSQGPQACDEALQIGLGLQAKGVSLISDSEAFLDWTDLGVLIQTSRDVAVPFRS